MPRTMQITTTAARTAFEPPERFSPLFNDAFLKIFGSADSAPVTLPLLTAVLRAAGLSEVERVNRIVADASLPGGVECKTPRLDVVMFSDDGRVFDLEAERRKVDVGNKSMYYGARLLSGVVGKGSDDTYGTIPQAVVVVLLEGSEMFPDSDQVVTPCRMRWDLRGGELDGPDRMVIVAAELDKVRELYNRGGLEEVLFDESLAWLYLLAAGYKDPEEVHRIMESFPTIEEFAERYSIAIGDPDLRRAYDKYYEGILEHNSIMYEARKEGREMGIEEGRAEGLAEGRAEGVEQSIAALRAAGLDDAADLLERTTRDAK